MLLKHGLLFYVEEVGQGRIIYLVKYDMLFNQGFTSIRIIRNGISRDSFRSKENTN
jgi:hypothetical protein